MFSFGIIFSVKRTRRIGISHIDDVPSVSSVPRYIILVVFYRPFQSLSIVPSYWQGCVGVLLEQCLVEGEGEMPALRLVAELVGAWAKCRPCVSSRNW